MFTGIIEDTGRVARIGKSGAVVRLDVETKLDLGPCRLGDSIAVDGVCLTATELDPGAGRVSFDVGPESLRVTALGRLQPGSRVHLERAMQMNGRLDGHIVQGHVDGVGRLLARRPEGETLHLRIGAAPDLLGLCIPKGSIAVNGTSLTINVLDDQAFEVWLIPHTLERTRLGELQVGDEVNLENDLIGKYVQRLLGAAPAKGLTWEKLREHGFTD